MIHLRIRPTELVVQMKREKLSEILLEWDNFTDYILHTVFLRSCSIQEASSSAVSSHHYGCAALPVPSFTAAFGVENSEFTSDSSSNRNLDNKKKKVENPQLYDTNRMVHEANDVLRIVFQENPFPYNLIDGYHWILWYNCRSQPYPNDQVNEDVHSNVLRLAGAGVQFDFAW